MRKWIWVKLFVCLVSYLFLLSKAYAATDTLLFVGKIEISKEVSYAYKIRFTIDAQSHISGLSLTDAGGPNDTKTRITGSFDSTNNTISFEEVELLRSKVDLSKNDLCFVKATLKLKNNKLGQVLMGRFTGVQPGKTTPCAEGEIKLINARKAMKLREFLTAHNPLSQKGSKVDSYQQQTPAAQPLSDIIKVSDDKARELPFTGTYVKFTIWDNGIVDGDRIALLINNKYILKDYTLDSTVKVIETTLTNNGVDTIKVIALNEGDIPPNTAMIKIESHTEQYPIEVRAKVGEERYIYLLKKKQ